MKYYLGIDIGGTKIAYGICDEDKNLVAKSSIKTDLPYEKMIEKLANCLKELVAENKISFDDVVSVGVGVPGVIDFTTNTLEMAPNLQWYNVDVVGEIKKYIDKDVFMANDADAATLGELLVGAGKDLKSMTMLTLGTGVGGGVAYNGKIFGGGDGAGIEIGHITLVSNGLQCGCLNKGCMEMYVSTSALIRIMRENVTKTSKIYEFCDGDLNKIDGKMIFQAADEKDPDALKTLEIYREYLASACYTAIMAYRTDALVIGGGISIREDLLIEPIKEKVYNMLKPLGRICNTQIITAKLGNDAGILGACFLSEM